MRILCYGDSNTYGFDPRSWLGGRYPADSRWPEILASKTGVDVINDGVCGRRIPKSIPATPNPILVMLGTNDLLEGYSAENTAKSMENALISSENVLIIAPPPFAPGDWILDSAMIGESILLANYYKEIAHGHSFRFLNAGDWNIPLTFDGVHFTEEGHRILADAILQTHPDLFAF